MTRTDKTGLYGPLRVLRIGKHRWKLTADWSTPFGVVPAGFETDGVSAGFLSPLARPDGSFFEAAVLHDWHYSNAIGSKALADELFYITARQYGVNAIRAAVAYRLCVLFGRGAYSAAR